MIKHLRIIIFNVIAYKLFKINMLFAQAFTKRGGMFEFNSYNY